MNKILVLVLAGLFISACNQDSKKSDGYGNFSAREIMVTSQISGEIIKSRLQKGNIIEKGTQVLWVDTIPLMLKRAGLVASGRGVDAAINEVVTLHRVKKEEVVRYHIQYERIKKLVKGDVATQQQLDEVESMVRISEAAEQSVLAKIARLKAEKQANDIALQKVAYDMSHCIIKSPCGGTILETYVEEGEISRAGQPLFKMADLKLMELDVYLSGKQLREVMLGQEAIVLVDGAEGMDTLKGSVSWISSTAEFTPKIIQTREERVDLVYAVTVIVANDGRLKIGMPAEVLLLAQKQEDE